jgi:hypothetical protein
MPNLVRHGVGKQYLARAGPAIGQILDTVEEDHRVDGKFTIGGLGDEAQFIALAREPPGHRAGQ